MKKLISLLLILTLASSCIVFTASADELPELLFDMDLSGCSEDNIEVLDSSGCSLISDIAPRDTANPPGYGVNEQDTPYLIFDTAGNTEARKVGMSVTYTEPIPNRDKLTFTTWICDVNSGSRTPGANDRISVFGFGQRAGSANELNLCYIPSGSEFYLRMHTFKTSNNSWKYFSENTHGMNQHKNKWTHIAVVVDWSQNAADATKSDLTMSYYINGKFVKAVTNAGFTRRSYTVDYGKTVLGIGDGGNAMGNSSFCGYIADLKLYDGLLTAEQVADEYFAEGMGYMEPVSAEFSIASYTRADEEFTLTFDGDVDTATLDGAKLYAFDGTPVKLSFKSYDEDTKTAAYTLHEYLAPGGEYELDISLIKDAAGFPLEETSISSSIADYREEIAGAPIVAYKDAEGNETADLSLAASTEVAVEVENKSDSSLTFYLGLVIYDSDGRGIRMPISEGVTVAAGSSDNLTVSTEEVVSGSSAATIIWCVTDSGVSYPVGTVTSLN